MRLRDYQTRAVADLRAVYQSGKRAPILCLPTAAGKTVVSAEVIRLALARGNRVLFAAGRIELLGQAVKKLADAGIRDVRVIQADNETGPSGAKVTVASIPTLATERWMKALPAADLVIADEVQHGAARTWSGVLNSYSGSRLLGLSATPQRGDGKALGDLFDAIVVGATVRELTDLGYLTQCKVYAPGRMLAPRELAMDPLAAYEQYARGLSTLVFAQTKVHARAIAESFQARSISTGVVFGDSRDREATLASFASGALDILVGVGIFIEGWDCPAATCAIFARRFTHVGGYLQAIGRLLRVHPGKREAIVVDLCGSALVHGTPDMEREYSLDGAGIKSADRSSLYRCVACGGVQLSTARGECTYCGHVQPALTRAKPKTLSEQLHEVSKDFEPREWNVRHAIKQRLCVECREPIAVKAKYVYVKGGPALHPGCAFSRARKVAAERARARSEAA